MISRRAILAGLGAASLPQAAHALPRDKIDLWENASGPHLRGAVLVQRRVYPDIDGPDFLGPGPVGAPVTDAALEDLARSGANLAILSHPGIFTESEPYHLDTDILTHLQDLVDRCARYGLFVVIGYRTGPGRSAFTFHRDDAGSWFPASRIDERVWREPACHAAWEEMWRQTARRFRHVPNIAGYLPMVEPNANQAGPQGEIWQPDRLARTVAGSPADWPNLARRLVTAIRAHDPGMPVLLSPDGYANGRFERLLDLDQDPRLVLALHDYEPRAYTHQAPGAGLIAQTGAGRLVPPHFHRWMMGEFGAVRWAPALDRYLAERLADLERAGAGWAYFRWDHGWRVYEDRENAFNLHYGHQAAGAWAPSTHPALARLRRAFGHNIHRAERNLRR